MLGSMTQRFSELSPEIKDSHMSSEKTEDEGLRKDEDKRAVT